MQGFNVHIMPQPTGVHLERQETKDGIGRLLVVVAEFPWDKPPNKIRVTSTSISIVQRFQLQKNFLAVCHSSTGWCRVSHPQASDFRVILVLRHNFAHKCATVQLLVERQETKDVSGWLGECALDKLPNIRLIQENYCFILLQCSKY